MPTVSVGIDLVVIRDGAQITTIEGLTDSAGNGRLHRLQQAFIDEDAFQCGYCTPGRIMSGVGCIAEGHTGSPAETREWMSGNICRCGAYTNIVKAVVTAARTHLHVFPFRYSKAADEQTALSAGAAAGARYLAGSTTLVDLMRKPSNGPTRWSTSAWRRRCLRRSLRLVRQSVLRLSSRVHACLV
jgi:xanthine dehydrogenase iron-sulfur cluster and FAD-binding subunit A